MIALIFHQQMIYVKRSRNQNNYNYVLFANRDIEKVTFTSCINIIGQYSFADCVNLKFVKNEKNSELCLIQL